MGDLLRSIACMKMTYLSVGFEGLGLHEKRVIINVKCVLYFITII